MKLKPIHLIGLAAIGVGGWYLFLRKPAAGPAVPGTAVVPTAFALTPTQNTDLNMAAMRAAAANAMARAMSTAQPAQGAEGVFWPYASDT